MKKIMISSIIALFILGGCNMTNNDDDAARDGRNPDVEQTRYKDNRNNGTNNHQMTNDNRANDRQTNDQNRDDRYDVSKEAADAITSEIPEVHQAYVVTTRNNAYVAAMFDDDQRDRADDTNWRNETERSRGNVDDNRRNDDHSRGSDDRNTNREDENTFDNRDESDQLTDDLKERISEIVREHDDGIENVYVTTNPEFSNLARDYMDDVDNGNPISGFFDQFGSMIERIFPQNK